MFVHTNTIHAPCLVYNHVGLCFGLTLAQSWDCVLLFWCILGMLEPFEAFRTQPTHGVQPATNSSLQDTGSEQKVWQAPCGHIDLDTHRVDTESVTGSLVHIFCFQDTGTGHKVWQAPDFHPSSYICVFIHINTIQALSSLQDMGPDRQCDIGERIATNCEKRPAGLQPYDLVICEFGIRNSWKTKNRRAGLNLYDWVFVCLA